MESYRRKKQPELVKKQLIEAGVSIALKRGLAAVTVQGVSEMAGVTKGGFLHHFPCKKDLILAMFNDLLFSVERDLEQHMAEDPEEYGSFTRAYSEFSMASAWDGMHDRRTALAVLSIGESELRSIWASWFNKMQRKHFQTDGDDHLAITRLTVDGLWMATLSDINLPNIGKIRESLLDATRKRG
jgi:AcrR family transcriptional regulator